MSIEDIMSEGTAKQGSGTGFDSDLRKVR